MNLNIDCVGNLPCQPKCHFCVIVIFDKNMFNCVIHLLYKDELTSWKEIQRNASQKVFKPTDHGNPTCPPEN